MDQLKSKRETKETLGKMHWWQLTCRLSSKTSRVRLLYVDLISKRWSLTELIIMWKISTWRCIWMSKQQYQLDVPHQYWDPWRMCKGKRRSSASLSDKFRQELVTWRHPDVHQYVIGCTNLREYKKWYRVENVLGYWSLWYRWSWHDVIIFDWSKKKT